MIESSFTAWAQFGLLVLLASGAGLALARALPLLHRPGLRPAIGLSLAPFLLGLASVVSLTAPRGATSVTRYALIVIMLLALAGLFRSLARSDQAIEAGATGRLGAVDLALLAILALASATLLVGAVTMPLTQNDSLEYFMAARRLYEIGDLAAYPPIDSAADPAGFYGPWTHPPLYPAMIYATMLCDDMVNMPGLMRLIAPWALITSTGLVIALGTTVSRRVGLLSGALYMTTPLLYLGADSALLDALAASACALMIALVAQLDRERRSAPVWAGIVLGVVMWTHSQMVLLALICFAAWVLLSGVRSPRAYVQAAIVAGAALPICAWPFLGNLARAGSLISDNPTVFALPQQDWEGYFRYARDLSTPVARLQYGVLKGWHSIEAYGFTFWFMLPGWIVAVSSALRPASSAGNAPRGFDVPIVAALFFSIYFAGMCTSAAMGIDLMIKTERYLLMIFPAVALLAAFSVVWCARIVGEERSHAFVSIVTMILVGVLAIQISTMFVYRLSRFALSPDELWRPLTEKLARWAPYRTMSYLRTMTPPRSVVLSLKPSDMVYAQRRMVSFLDPAMAEAYEERSARGFVDRLVGMNVDYVHIPDYPLPPLYRSMWEEALADESLTRLMADNEGHQVYALGQAASGKRCLTERIAGSGQVWTRSVSHSFGGRKRLVDARSREAVEASVNDANRPLPPFFQRDVVTRIESPVFPLPGDAADSAACTSSREIRVQFDLLGSGFVTVYASFLGADGSEIEERSIGGTIVSEGVPGRFAHRLLVPSGAERVRWILEHRGTARIGIASASVAKIAN